MSVSHVEADPKKVLDGFAKHIQIPSFGGFGDSRKLSIVEAWKIFSPESKEEWCKSMWASVQVKMPLFFSVAPAMRDVLWPITAHSRGVGRGVLILTCAGVCCRCKWARK
jgi:hypothetical protein